MKSPIVIILCLSIFSSRAISYPQSDTNSVNSLRPLYEIVKTENANIQTLINNVENVDLERDKNGNTALLKASEYGNYEAVDLLIRKGANIEALNRFQHTALMLAAEKGHHAIVNLLIQKRVNVDAHSRYRKTALMRAAENGHYEVVDLLIQNEANVNTKDSSSRTPLMYAAMNGHYKILELLLSKGADVNALSDFNVSALMFAAISGHERIIQLLLRNGADFKIKNQSGQTAKDFAIERGFSNISNLFDVSQRACNLYHNPSSDRIVGGEMAVVGELPWIAALGYLGSNDKLTFDCGGTIISDSFILTAAHCVKNKRRPVRVRLGNLNPTHPSGPGTETHYIEKIIRHPDYSTRNKKSDIALIQLVDLIYFSDTIMPACLHTDRKDVDSNIDLIVAGWGINSTESRTRSSTLLKTNLKTMPLTQCNSILLEYNEERDLPAIRDGISENQYCAYDPNGKKDSCEGDSGGPLQMIDTNSNVARVVGVISFGVGACGAAIPSVYTRVASYLDWIESIVWPNDEVQPPLVNYLT